MDSTISALIHKSSNDIYIVRMEIRDEMQIVTGVCGPVPVRTARALVDHQAAVALQADYPEYTATNNLVIPDAPSIVLDESQARIDWVGEHAPWHHVSGHDLDTIERGGTVTSWMWEEE